MKKINAFTLQEPDTCVRCGLDMPEGTEVSWLRTTVSKGYFHTACVDKPIIERLLKVKVQAADSPLGYIYMRANAVLAGASLGETTPATQLIPSHNPSVPNVSTPVLNLRTLLAQYGADKPLPGPWEVKQRPEIEGLIERIAEAVAQSQPRIVVNVYVAKPGEEVRALDLLSKELFLLQSVQQ